MSAACGQGSKSTPPTTELFTDITAERRLSFTHGAAVEGKYWIPESIGSGGGFLDYDNDGDLDIYLVNGAWRGAPPARAGQLRDRLFRQDANGRFTDVTLESGMGDTGYGLGVAVGDIDNDGDVDVYVTNVGSDALYRNDGGRFTNIARRAGIEDSSFSTSAAFFDYDVDGYLDLYVANYVQLDTTVTCVDEAGRPDYCGPQVFAGAPDMLYHNNGDGTFSDASRRAGIAGAPPRKGLGVVSADFNGDGLPDVYVANDGEPNLLWVNRGDGTFVDRAVALGAAVNAMGNSEAGMGVAMGDIEDDGDVDLFVTHLRYETNTLYRNRSNQGLGDETAAAGLEGPSLLYTGFGTGFVDFDHDADLDLIVVNGRVTRGPRLVDAQPAGYWDDYAEPNLLFENVGNGRFVDASFRAPDLTAPVENSRGLAFGDIDNDGDLDLLVTNGGGTARLLRGDATTGHWLGARVVEPTMRRDAYGARVAVIVGDRIHYRLVTSAYSYLSSNDPRVLFGLGAAVTVDGIVVQWPDGSQERFPGGGVDRYVTLEKGNGKLGR